MARDNRKISEVHEDLKLVADTLGLDIKNVRDLDELASVERGMTKKVDGLKKLINN